MPVVWHATHLDEMKQNFDDFAAAAGSGDGWNPKANTNQRKKYFENVINDESSAFGVIPEGRTRKLTLDIFLRHFSQHSKNWLSRNEYPTNIGGTKTSTEIAKLVSEMTDTNSNFPDEDIRDDAVSEPTRNGVKEFTATALGDNEIQFPVVQSSYSRRIVGQRRKEERITIFLLCPSGWISNLETDMMSFFQLSEDKQSIVLSFKASDYLTSPRDASDILSHSELLSNIYANNASTGVMHPARTAVADAVEQRYGDCFDEERIVLTIPLMKKCSRLVSIEGLDKDLLKSSQQPEDPIQLLFSSDSWEEIGPTLEGIVHLELAVQNDDKKSLSRSYYCPQESENSGPRSPRSGNHSRHGSRSSFSKGSSSGNSGSFGNRYGGSNGGDYGLRRSSNGRVASLSPPPRQNPVARARKKRLSLSPTRSSHSPREWNQYRRDEGSFSDSTEGEANNTKRKAADPPTADSPEGRLDTTANTIDMDFLSRELESMGIEATATDSEEIKNLKMRVGNLEDSHSQLQSQVGTIQKLLLIAKDDDGVASSELLDFFERNMNRLEDRLSKFFTFVDTNSRLQYEPLVSSINQMRGSLRRLSAEVAEQVALKVKLEDAASRIENTDKFQSELNTLKQSLDGNAKLVSNMQDQFTEQRDSFEAKLSHWHEAGEVVLADISEIKNAQKRLESVLSQRGELCEELFEAVNAVSPIKAYN